MRKGRRGAARFCRDKRRPCRHLGREGGFNISSLEMKVSLEPKEVHSKMTS